MRAGPLSDDKVIETLNQYYIPVYTSQEDYDKGSHLGKAELQAYADIYHTALKEKMSCGSVCGYFLDPKGKVLESAVVTTLSKDDFLLRTLKAHADSLGTQPGRTIVEPRKQSAAPPAKTGSLVLHLVSRAEGTGPNGGSWREFPGENWVVFEKSDAARLLPVGKVEKGKTWELNPAITKNLLIYFYPQSEDPYDKPDCKIESQSLKATVVSFNDGIARARIDGTLRMHHNFYPGRSGNMIDATIIGYLEFDASRKQIRSLKLVTERATFGPMKFDVAVKSQPPQTR